MAKAPSAAHAERIALTILLVVMHDSVSCSHGHAVCPFRLQRQSVAKAGAPVTITVLVALLVWPHTRRRSVDCYPPIG